MKSTTIIALSILTLVSSCSNETTDSQKETLTANELPSDPSKVKTNASVNLEIEGMMCVKGCGAEIRRHLYNTSAVSTISYDFLDGRNTNFASVEFDNSLISEEEIIEVIENIEDSEFKAKLKENKKVNQSDSQSNSAEKPVLKVKSENFKFPDITDIFKSLIL